MEQFQFEIPADMKTGNSPSQDIAGSPVRSFPEDNEPMQHQNEQRQMIMQQQMNRQAMEK